MPKSKELAALKQLLILRHPQTAGARLRNPIANSRRAFSVNWIYISAYNLLSNDHHPIYGKFYWSDFRRFAESRK